MRARRGPGRADDVLGTERPARDRREGRRRAPPGRSRCPTAARPTSGRARRRGTLASWRSQRGGTGELRSLASATCDSRTKPAQRCWTPLNTASSPVRHVSSHVRAVSSRARLGSPRPRTSGPTLAHLRRRAPGRAPAGRGGPGGPGRRGGGGRPAPRPPRPRGPRGAPRPPVWTRCARGRGGRGLRPGQRSGAGGSPIANRTGMHQLADDSPLPHRAREARGRERARPKACGAMPWHSDDRIGDSGDGPASAT